jgi:hypothetical protein
MNTERFNADERGVSEVVGAILVFGVVVALLAIIQAQAIPAANKVVEYNHNQEVQGDVIDLQEAASRSGALGTAESVKIQAGTTYPSRLFFFNPSSPSGTIKTEGGPPPTGQNVVLRNMLAQDDEVRQYINGDPIGDLETKRFVYEPNYNEYRNPPNTTLEYGVLYNQYDNGENVIVNEGSVVRGNQITLTFFGGDLSTGQSGSLSLEALPASAPARTVSVKPAGGNDIEIKLPTKLSADTWENDILDGEANVLRVESVTGEDAVVLVLDGTQDTYDLRMSVVGIGPNSPNPASEYMLSRDGSLVRTGQSTSALVTLEVRDKYNNPVADEDIDLNLDGQGSLAQTTVTTNRQGQATVQYTPAKGTGKPPYTSTIEASYDIDPDPSTSSYRPFDSTRTEDVAVDVQVQGQPTGTKPSVDTFELKTSGTSCVDPQSPLFGNESTQLNISWEASITGSNSLSSARIEMVDQQNGQLATSTSYSLSGKNANRNLLLRDERPNDNSCNKDYDVFITVRSDGGQPAPDKLEAKSGCTAADDYEPDPRAGCVPSP